MTTVAFKDQFAAHSDSWLYTWTSRPYFRSHSESEMS